MKKLENRVDLILDRLRELPGEVKVIAIEGRCASGKTTLAEQLSRATGAGVVHMDDFFLPRELRTRERMAEPGGNVHYERFEKEVLSGLKSGDGFRYRRFDCGRMEPGGERRIPAGRLRIVEGAYSCHPRFGRYMNLQVFCNVTGAEQKRRIAARNGEEALAEFLGKWIPLEERYFDAYSIYEQADIVIH